MCYCMVRRNGVSGCFEFVGMSGSLHFVYADRDNFFKRISQVLVIPSIAVKQVGICPSSPIKHQAQAAKSSHNFRPIKPHS